MGDDTPDFTAIIPDGQGREVRVLGRQLPCAADLLQPFDGQLAVNDGNDDIVGLRGDSTVDDEQVTIENPGAAHGFSGRAHKEGCRRPPHRMLVEIELALDVVIGRAGEEANRTGAIRAGLDDRRSAALFRFQDEWNIERTLLP
jgi:hypothetical protein